MKKIITVLIVLFFSFWLSVLLFNNFSKNKSYKLTPEQNKVPVIENTNPPDKSK